MTDMLRWGIVGCGDVVEKKSGPSIRDAGASRIVAIMRRDMDKARAFAEAYDVATATDDPAEVIAHRHVDIVYVATPPAAHRRYVLDAAAAGKHVLVEKPMGLSVNEDREMIAACREAGVELFVAYYRRFQPHVLRMKELLDAGDLGEPVSAQVDFAQPSAGRDWGWRTQPAISGGGLFVDVVSHRIDLLVHLLGEPTAVTGVSATDSRVESAAALAVKFASNAVASITGDFASPRRIDRFVIAGTQGVISTDELDGQGFELQREGQVERLAFDRFSAPHLGLIRHIQDVLGGRDVNRTSGAQAIHTDMILDRGLARGEAQTASLTD